jgi:putative transposase
MPSKTKMKNAAIAARSAALLRISDELIDQFVTGPMTGEAVNAATVTFKKALIERALGAELGHHRGYPSGAPRPEAATNQRNGKSAKTVLTDDGPLRIEVPRDRDGSFEPLLIPKHERRFTGFDDKIIALYARGMTVREVQGFLAEQYGTEVSAEFISLVTEAVMAEVSAWQTRPLEPMYPVVFFDALRVKTREAASPIGMLTEARRNRGYRSQHRVRAHWSILQKHGSWRLNASSASWGSRWSW